MHQRVTAILVARSGAQFLPRTIDGLAAQTSPPDDLVVVDIASRDAGRELLAAVPATRVVQAPADSTFGQAVARALDALGPATSENDWIWLLGHDNAPAPDALAALRASVEVAPSLVVVGPKLMEWHRQDTIAEFGESITRFGRSIALVTGELDQAQHDVADDVLGVAAGGMLVKRAAWSDLGGFDPALPTTDASLDFSIRARLAGGRVALVSDARVLSAGGPEDFGRAPVSEPRRARIARRAQLHRRLVYAPTVAVPFHWLSLVPLAVLRAISHLITKRPREITGEFAAALGVAFSGAAVPRSRSVFARTRRVGWRAISSLRASTRTVREQRRNRRELEPGGGAGGTDLDVEPVGFVSGGGLWAVVGAFMVGLIAWGVLLGSPSVVGGGALPLHDSLAALWGNVGYGWRTIGAGFIGAADPFAAVLAVLGSVVFWQPSVAVVVLYLLALPAAALGAWFCARRFTATSWVPAVLALIWAVAPPLLGALDAGRVGAALAHVLLPWLMLAVLKSTRSIAAAAAASVLLAVVVACAPVLAPALLVLLVAWIAVHPRSIARTIGIPLPLIVLFAPLAIDQISRGTPLAVLADPGAPAPGTVVSGLQLALGSAADGSNGWSALLATIELPGPIGPIVAAALLLPLGVLALLALFVRGSRRTIPALVVALLGFATAVLAVHIEVTTLGDGTVAIWAGSALSLFWLGVVGSAAVALDALGRRASGTAVLLGVASVLAVLPLVSAGFLGTSLAQPSTGRVLPAFVDAEAGSDPDIATLSITALPARDGVDDRMLADLQRGRGTLLDDQSTLAATDTTLSDADLRVATLAGNLVSRSGYDTGADLRELAIGFVVLADLPAGADDTTVDTYTRAQEALDGNAQLVPIGTTANGLLWRYTGEVDAAPTGPGNTETAWGLTVLIVQGAVFAIAVLLAIPSSRRRSRAAVRAPLSEPATTFDEERDD